MGCRIFCYLRHICHCTFYDVQCISRDETIGFNLLGFCMALGRWNYVYHRRCTLWNRFEGQIYPFHISCFCSVGKYHALHLHFDFCYMICNISYSPDICAKCCALHASDAILDTDYQSKPYIMVNSQPFC